jgi:hypothetical protein
MSGKINNETSVVDETFNKIDEKLSILNKETIDWIKGMVIYHIGEAYDRGKKDERKLIDNEIKFKNCR